jgi:hypothetical protein
MKKQNTANNGREQATRAAIGSIRCEGLRPSIGTNKHLRNYSSGKITADQLHESVMNEVESILAHSR